MLLMWSHSQRRLEKLSGPAFINSSPLYHTPAAVITPVNSFCAIIPLITKTTDDALLCPLCCCSLMVCGIDSYHTCVGIAMPCFSAWICFFIVCRPSVLLPIYLNHGTEWIFSLSQALFPSQLMTPLSTDLAARMIMLWHRRANCAVGFRGMIAVIVPLASRDVFMI